MSAPGRQPSTPATDTPETTRPATNPPDAAAAAAAQDARTREPLSTADLASADERIRRADEEEARRTTPPMSPATSTGAVAAAATARAGSRTDERTDEEQASPLFADEASAVLWRRWDSIQAGFVDEPRRAVEQADSLVAETMKSLAESFARARTGLEEQWGRGDDVSTEDLRVALRRYRSFFKRLLSV